jgi:hypothetical protein
MGQYSVTVGDVVYGWWRQRLISRAQGWAQTGAYSVRESLEQLRSGRKESSAFGVAHFF